MNKTKRTIANALAQSMSVIIQSLFALFVTREIIANIGSDYNGITSTATQLLSFLSVIEGGLTLATLVLLYKPFNERNFKLIGKYVSLSKKKYQKIGLIYFLLSCVVSIGYAPFVKTQAGIHITIIILLLSSLSSAFTIFYTSKYRLLFQVSQSEYIVYITQATCNILMYILEIIIIKNTKSIVLARVCVAFFQILSGICIGIIARIKFKMISYKEDTSDVEITGTKDVFLSKITGLIFTTAPTLFISTFISTVVTSVFAVYNSVLSIVQNVINAMLQAPRNALGQLVNSNDKDEKISLIMDEYDYTACFLTSVVSSIFLSLIIPFIRWYTRAIADTNYIDPGIAILLTVNILFQMIHFPSGICIEVSGNFKTLKKIQTIGAVSIIILSTIGALVFGLYGVLLGKLITSVLLAIMEISYTRKKIIKSGIFTFLKITIPNLLIGICISIPEFVVTFNLELSILKLFLLGAIIALINISVFLLINMLISRRNLIVLLKRFTRSVKRV